MYVIEVGSKPWSRLISISGSGDNTQSNRASSCCMSSCTSLISLCINIYYSKPKQRVITNKITGYWKNEMQRSGIWSSPCTTQRRLLERSSKGPKRTSSNKFDSCRMRSSIRLSFILSLTRLGHYRSLLISHTTHHSYFAPGESGCERYHRVPAIKTRAGRRESQKAKSIRMHLILFYLWTTLSQTSYLLSIKTLKILLNARENVCIRIGLFHLHILILLLQQSMHQTTKKRKRTFPFQPCGAQPPHSLSLTLLEVRQTLRGPSFKCMHLRPHPSLRLRPKQAML